uniref:Hypotheticial protein n=1 Tax=Schistosoma japonicum TaxID=6182 RepID=C7TZ36_SCHJA|nr:hypotheticial protein [Schistosoma japonicum]CAX82894.1 hypotheticial protein [Schistosoma japonicum]
MFKSFIILSILYNIFFLIVKINCAITSNDYELEHNSLNPLDISYYHDEPEQYYFPNLRDSLVKRLLKRKYYMSQRLGK